MSIVPKDLPVSEQSAIAPSWEKRAVTARTELVVVPAREWSSVAAQWTNVTDAATRLDSDLSAIASAAGTHNSSATQKAATSLAADASALTQAITPIKQKLGLK